jgi:hypothetical protein
MGLGVNGPDVHDLRVVAQVAPLRGTGAPNEMLVVPKRSIGWAFTTLLSAPLSLPCRWAVTRLNNAYSITPRVQAAAARLCAPVTKRTASRVSFGA